MNDFWKELDDFMKQTSPTELKPSWDLKAEEVAKAREWAASGLTDEAIATQLSTTVEGMRMAFGKDLDEARLETNLAVLDTLLTMAKSGKHLGATMFWIKTHCSDLVPALEATEGTTKKKKEYVWDPNDPNDRVIFGVYNNDGEPNADY